MSYTEKIESKINQSYRLTCEKIDGDKNISNLKKRYLKKTAYRLCFLEVMEQHNRIINCRGMIEADIESRRYREFENSKCMCRCKDGSPFCFCVDSRGKWIRF